MDIAYTVVFDRNKAGGYTVTVPALPGLVTEGSTLPEAKTMAVDAIRCYVEGLIKDREPILHIEEFIAEN
jgi:predicted RNase H-like HicB family nuclease